MSFFAWSIILINGNKNRTTDVYLKNSNNQAQKLILYKYTRIYDKIKDFHIRVLNYKKDNIFFFEHPQSFQFLKYICFSSDPFF